MLRHDQTKRDLAVSGKLGHGLLVGLLVSHIRTFSSVVLVWSWLIWPCMPLYQVIASFNRNQMPKDSIRERHKPAQSLPQTLQRSWCIQKFQPCKIIVVPTGLVRSVPCDVIDKLQLARRGRECSAADSHAVREEVDNFKNQTQTGGAHINMIY